MAKTKEELIEINKHKKMLLSLLMEKTGTKRKDLIELAEQQFIISNLDVLTSSEKKRFNKLVLK